MTALSQNADVVRRIAELEQKLQSSAAETERLQRELAQSRERQAASADILATIAGTSGDADRALEQIAQTTARLFGASSVSIQLVQNGEWGKAYRYGASAQRIRAAVPLTAIKVGGRNMPGAVVGRNRQIHAPDLDNLDPDLAEFPGLPHARAAGTRTICGTPLRSQDKAIGALLVHRDRLEPFSDEELVLLQSFADQAAIALENARLFNETRETLERQTATAEILKVIASSPTDVQPVFDAIASSAKRLIGGFSTAVFRFVDDIAHLAAFTPTSPAADEVLKGGFPSPVARFEPFRLAQGGKPVQIADIEALPDSQIKQIARARGFRSMLFAPLMSNSVPIGLISVTRLEAGSFVDHHVQLLQTFADQAVIAIENARLFAQVKARTRDLTEALTYQTGSANILKVIASSPTDVEPVLRTIVESACELCEAYDAVLILKEECDLVVRAHHGPIAMGTQTWTDDRTSVSGLAIAERVPIHVHDVISTEGANFPIAQAMSRQDGCRTLLAVPMLSEGECIGAIVLRRAMVQPFGDKQVTLLQTFADQAVIALGNVRLFEEVQARTRELAKSLDELRAAQDRLVQTEKLASLGHLTAGIAHEIKNPLNFVNNFSALSAELISELNELLGKAALDDEIRADVDELAQMLKGNFEKIVQHGKRADSIVKNMLLHSREGSGERRSADINAIVEESLSLAYHGARAEKSDFNVTLKRDLDPNAGTAELYPQEITRVFLNLISNGFYAAQKRREAAGDAFEPTLSATTRALADEVEIRIRDNGTGIPEEVRAKIFNPFFTTKPAGEGTGLGLSMTHDIVVKQHGGKIDVETEPGAFTEFIITLPRMGAAQDNSGGRS